MTMSEKQVDALHYEIGNLQEQVRGYKHLTEVQSHQIEKLVGALVAIRNAHRNSKNYEVADAIRSVLESLGFEVKDNHL
jgi:cysteinyl-tRNA synthetase